MDRHPEIWQTGRQQYWLLLHVLFYIQVLLGAFKGLEGAPMAVSAQEKPSASYLYLHPPALSARRVKVVTSQWACSRLSLVVGSICSACSRFMLWVHLHVILTISGTICIEILFPVYQDWKLIWEETGLLLSRFSAERWISYIYSLNNSFLSACFLLTLVFAEAFSGIPVALCAEWKPD